MSFTRRHFVQAASLTLIASAAYRSGMAQAVSDAQDETFSPDNLNLYNGISVKTFEPLVGENFSVKSARGPQGSLVLISVQKAGSASSEGTAGRVPKSAGESLSGFTLRFEGPGPGLPQGTYTLRNHNIGSLPLLLVPSGPGMATTTYTAVFNFAGGPENR
ncbi:MAG TPA: hypothetical protein VHX60_16665 [Acidobacteriaceae bacterium]|jgi:hypothetical protein|nr:hypothetical protein [Acidobacteriaceae bacterium]